MVLLLLELVLRRDLGRGLREIQADVGIGSQIGLVLTELLDQLDSCRSLTTLSLHDLEQTLLALQVLLVASLDVVGDEPLFAVNLLDDGAELGHVEHDGLQ